MEKYDILKNLVVEMLLNPHLQKLMLVKLKLLYTFLVQENFRFYRLSPFVLYFLIRTT